MQLGDLPRVKIASTLTPMQEAVNLRRELGGPRIFIKRDDLTGLAFGGSKCRALEFIMGDALSKGSDIVVAGASWHSNWCTQVAAAARKLGMRVILYKTAPKEEYDPEEYDGNHLLHHLLGAEVHAVKPMKEALLAMEVVRPRKKRLMARLTKEGHRPYDANESPYGVVGYVDLVLELLSQVNEKGMKIDYIVVAHSSGNTQAGLMLGSEAMNTGMKVLGVTIQMKKKPEEDVADYVNKGSELLDLNLRVDPEEVLINDGYHRGGYGVIDREVVEAIELVARREGILLDPVYTGKAMAGLIDLVEKGFFREDETVLFLHTGGLPGLFPYRASIKAIKKSVEPPWKRPPWLPRLGSN